MSPYIFSRFRNILVSQLPAPPHFTTKLRPWVSVCDSSPMTRDEVGGSVQWGFRFNMQLRFTAGLVV